MYSLVLEIRERLSHGSPGSYTSPTIANKIIRSCETFLKDEIIFQTKLRGTGKIRTSPRLDYCVPPMRYGNVVPRQNYAMLLYIIIALYVPSLVCFSFFLY